MRDVDTSLEFTAVPGPILHVVWPDVEPMLQKALDVSPKGYTTEAIHAELLQGTLGLWVVLDKMHVPVAAITTRITDLPEARVLAMDWIGGSRMAEWFEQAMATLEDYARVHQCTQLQGYGRKAWERWLSPCGWKPAYMTYKKDLDDGQ